MFIDSHCHIDINTIKQDILEAKKVKVNYIIGNGTNIENCRELIELSKQYEELKVAIGFHPSEINEETLNEIEILEELIKCENVVAIGEIGLDFYYEKENKQQQIIIFKKMLDLANKYNLPVIIHSRLANEQIIEILKNYKLKGIIHCFNGTLEEANEFIKMGFLLGVNGIITFNNTNELIEVIKHVPLEYIVLETDAPYLTPVPYRGKTNASRYIPLIAKRLAEIKNTSEDLIEQITTEDVLSKFDFCKKK